MYPLIHSTINLLSSSYKDTGISHTSGVPSAGNHEEAELTPPTEVGAEL